MRRRLRQDNQVQTLIAHPKQTKFITSTAKVALFRGAIASGKTVSGLQRSILRRYWYPGTVQLIAGPSWDQLRDGTIRSLLRYLNPRCIVEHNKNEHRIVLNNRSEFMYRTVVDPDVMRALEVHDIWFDEWSLCSDETLDIGLGRARLPFLGKKAPEAPPFEHSIWGTTTPRGFDWTLDAFGEEGKDVPYVDHAACPPDDYEKCNRGECKTGMKRVARYDVVHATIFDNRRNLPPGYIENLVEKYKDSPFYEQELLGLYTAFEGLVYPMFRKEKHVQPAPAELKDCPFVAVGADFGRIAPSAMVIVGERGSGGIHAYDEFYKVGADLSDMLERLVEWAELAERPRSAIAVPCDPSATVVIETFRSAGFDAFPADKDKLAGIALVQERLNGRGGRPTLTVDRNCPYLVNEFGQYIWLERRHGKTKVMVMVDQPIDHHADALDALRYAVVALAQREPEEEWIVTPMGRRIRARRSA